MRRNNVAGFTLLEVTIVLLVLAVLASILLPSIGGFNSLARTVRVKEDLGVLCSMMKVMLDDLGNSAFFQTPNYGQGGYPATSVGYASGSSTSGVAGASGMSMTATTRSTPEWCDNCDMPRSECGDCRDDCGPDCRAGCGPDCQAPVSGETVQTWNYTSGRRVAAGTGYASYGRNSSGYGGYGDAYGAGYGSLGWPVGLLVGSGDTPGSGIGYSEWQLALGADFTESSNGLYPTVMSFRVGSLDRQLVHGDPSFLSYGAYGTGVSGSGRYGNGAAYGAGALGGYGGYGSAYPSYVLGTSFFAWRGPYIADAIAPDPWGNRYMANVFALHAPAVGTYPVSAGYRRHVELFSSATVCYSAGPDETIQTPFNQPYGWYSGGDDVTVVLAGAGGIR